MSPSSLAKLRQRHSGGNVYRLNVEPPVHDLRQPDDGETPLSACEVERGIAEGVIRPGPVAQARAFADVLVVQTRRVEVLNLEDVA